jgi:hypothetical protein
VKIRKQIFIELSLELVLSIISIHFQPPSSFVCTIEEFVIHFELLLQLFLLKIINSKFIVYKKHQISQMQSLSKKRINRMP